MVCGIQTDWHTYSWSSRRQRRSWKNQEIWVENDQSSWKTWWSSFRKQQTAGNSKTYTERYHDQGSSWLRSNCFCHERRCHQSTLREAEVAPISASYRAGPTQSVVNMWETKLLEQVCVPALPLTISVASLSFLASFSSDRVLLCIPDQLQTSSETRLSPNFPVVLSPASWELGSR